MLVTDINMPFLDGPGLIRAIREKNGDLPVVVLSGYDDFHYVHDALLAGASEYLLKPLDPRKILAVVLKSIQSVRDIARERGESDRFRTRVAEAESILNDRRMSALLQPDGFGEWEAGVGPGAAIPGFEPCWLLLVNSGCPEISFAREVLRSCFGSRAFLIFNNAYSPGEFIVLFGARQSGRDATCNNVLAKLGQGHAVRIGISRRLDSPGDIQKAYAEALSAIRSKPASIGSVRVSIEDVDASSVSVRVTATIESELSLALRSCDRAQASDIIRNRIGLTPEKMEAWSWYELKDTVDRVLRIVMQSCLLPGTFSDGRIALENTVDMIQIAIDFRDSSRVAELLDDLVGALIDRQPATAGGDSMRGVVRLVRLHVEEHYFEDLSLASLSDLFHVESTYLSRSFKQETGENLIVYITKCRIGKATEHIGSGDLSFANVASLVGYDDYAYFNRVFRKVTGMSPSEYREYARAEGRRK